MEKKILHYGIMENIEQEIENKEVERIKEVVTDVVVNEPENVVVSTENIAPKPSKKVRSKAQIEAFKKAQEKRKANILLKKESLAQEVIKKKEVKKAIKEKVEEEFSAASLPVNAVPNVSFTEPPEKIPIQSTRKSVLNNVDKVHNGVAPIINNYYYSGAPPPEVEREKKKRGRKKKVVIESSSSSEESSDEDIPPPEVERKVIKKKIPIKKTVEILPDTPLDNPYQREINKLKFTYA